VRVVSVFIVLCSQKKLVVKDGGAKCANVKEVKDVGPMMLGSHMGSLRWQIQWWAFGQRHEMDLA